MLTTVKTLTLFGLEAHQVEIEIDVSRGMNRFVIVGLADTAIQESKERVQSAIKNSGFYFPRKSITVNLAPAELRKTGSLFDMAIALGILITTKQITIQEDISQYIFCGELGFNGAFRSASGILPLASEAKNMGFTKIFVPEKNATEAAFIEEIETLGVESLSALADHFSQSAPIPPKPISKKIRKNFSPNEIDMKDIEGQEQAKRAMEIAAAGGHNILFSGPPGSGKSMLAKAMSGILPTLNMKEMLEITKIHSIAGMTSQHDPIIDARPFRSIHHTASGVAIVGGGNPPRPGEISLAHRGVLFLDEFAEFPQKTLEVLRQPLEDGIIRISRSTGTSQFPARMLLVAAMNPCPCGYYGDKEKECHCTVFQRERYRNKISGPIIDRIDLLISVPRVKFQKLTHPTPKESSQKIQKRIQLARNRQQYRFYKSNIQSNTEMTSPMVKQFCLLNEEAQAIIKQAVEKMHLSGRAYFRILKVARSIADLADKENILPEHIAEAISYRM